MPEVGSLTRGISPAMMAAYKLLLLSEVDSTNAFLRRSAAMLDDRTVVVAKRQTSGRGRHGRVWHTDEAGGLALSILLRDDGLLKRHSDNVAGLTQFVAVLLCRMCVAVGVVPVIKWPNDILVGERKLAGILSEAIAGPDGIEAVIVGIGVNLNTTPTDLALIDRPATSVFAETGNPIEREMFTQTLLDLFFSEYQSFLARGVSEILSEYRAFFSAFIGRFVRVKLANSSVSGRVVGIDDAGRLLLEQASGKTSVLAGEIECATI